MEKHNPIGYPGGLTKEVAWGCALALTGGLFLVGDAIAADTVTRGPDTVNRNQTVFERSRPKYDAKGLPIGGGGLSLFPSLDVSEKYDNNVYATKNNKRDDFETIIEPTLTLKSNWSRHSLSATAYGRINHYADLTTENNKEYGAQATGVLDLPHASTLVATGGYSRQTIARGDPEQSNGVGSSPEQVDLLTGGAQYSHPFGRIRVTVGGTVNDYETVDGADPGANRTEYKGTARVAYEISAALNAFVEPYYQARRYDIGGLFNRDVDIYGIGVGFGYDITGKLYGETQVGYYKADFKSNVYSDTSGVFVRSEATWNLSALTSIIGGIERGNQASNVGTASSSTTSAIDLRVEREIARNITAAITGRYERQKYENFSGGRQDNYYRIGWIANYLIDRHVALFVQYQYQDRHSDVSTAEYRDNQVTLGIKGQL